LIVVEEQPYIVFEVQSTPLLGRRLRGRESFGPSSAVLSVESLTTSDAADARRAPGLVVAEPLPTKLIQPVAAAGATGPAEPGTAWGVEAVGATESPFSGKGIKVAVLDTGIDASHEAFNGLQITQRDFTGAGDGDKGGHGTHCAGTVAGQEVKGFRYGVAPGIDELLVGKVLGVDGGTTDGIARAMLWALESGANIISMSLGLDFPGLVARWAGKGLSLQPATSRALEAYRDNLRLFGALAAYIRASSAFGRTALVVAATGNESQRGSAEPYTIGVAPPAASEGFIAVGALRKGPDGGLAVADFSNTGPAVAAPGVDIVSARKGGGFTSMSGTSMATPHVVGVAALWAESLMASTGQLDPGLLAARLTGNSRELPDVAAADGGAGLVQAPH
jgi:subtilisin family serine protease